MDPSRAAISISVGVIVVTMLASGPLMSAVDFTTERGKGVLFETELDDQAAVIIIDEPAGPAVLERTGPQAVYRLLVPSMTVEVTEVHGSPRLSYHIRILEMNFVGLTTYFLNESWVGRERQIRLAETKLNESRITQDEYRGDITLAVHGTNGTKVIYETNVTVEVHE